MFDWLRRRLRPDAGLRAGQHVKSITVWKQVIRADGTREPVQLAAYMDRDPKEMKRVLFGKKLPETAKLLDETPDAAPVAGRVTAGAHVLDVLNSASPKDAKRIIKLNERRSAG